MKQAARALAAVAPAYRSVRAARIDSYRAAGMFSMLTLPTTGAVPIASHILDSHAARAERCRVLHVMSADASAGVFAGDELLAEAQEIPALHAAGAVYLCLVDNGLALRRIIVDRCDGALTLAALQPHVPRAFLRIPAPQAQARVRIHARVIGHFRQYR